MKVKIIIITSFLLLAGCDQDSIISPFVDGRITAAHNITAIKTLPTFFAGLLLISITSEGLEHDGYSDKWTYRYTTGGIAVDYYYHLTSREAKFDSTSKQLDGLGFIRHKWFNSDKALQIAESKGGKEFRKRNKDYTIEAALVEPLWDDFDIKDVGDTSNGVQSIISEFLE